jgi:hypothetical protein
MYEVETIGSFGAWDQRLEQGCRCASRVSEGAQNINGFLDSVRELLRRAKSMPVPGMPDPIPYAHAIVGPRGWGDMLTKAAVVAGVVGVGVVAYRTFGKPGARRKTK